ncbi:CAP domain-containing protein [Planosporangium sp. 12N6]|uniref:CAP domain-containing protein n=1 Tax=Planosporangium spinosum TaxID=3402278 RepID=UPI003CF78AEB
MHTPPTKPPQILDAEPLGPADRPPRDPSPRRRALRPAVVAATAAVAVGLSSAIGVLVVGGAGERTTKVAADRTDPAPTTAIDTGVSSATQAADPALAGRAGLEAAPGASPTAQPTVTRPAPAATTPTRRAGAGGTAPAPAPPATVRAAAPAGTPASADVDAEAAVVMLVNQERAKAGCDPLSVDSRLATAARDHSADMAARDYFAHDTPEGVSVGTRVTNAGYRWSAVGENIAKGQSDATSVMQAWMNSPGHRANILNCRYTNIGVGLAYQGRTPLWTQDFGTPLG